MTWKYESLNRFLSGLTQWGLLSCRWNMTICRVNLASSIELRLQRKAERIAHSL